LNYTEQGIRNIKQGPDRVEAARKLMAEQGGQLKDFYLTLGTYDAVSVMEAPDDETAAKILLSLGALGNVRTVTLRAFDEGQYRGIIGNLP
jgi:uncharacterized protein with GYD domain